MFSYPNPEQEQLHGLCSNLIKSILVRTNREDLLDDMLEQLHQYILDRRPASGSPMFGKFDFLDELTSECRYVK